jgi:hypothetical protein
MEIYKFKDWSRCSKQYNIYVLFFKYLVHFNLITVHSNHQSFRIIPRPRWQARARPVGAPSSDLR